ncbi:MAG TPA: low molecular weight protein-tyrosine-phosphatase [Nocardioides sp.]|nr:low molecular weight protein-tyrosine-phosphatase [Nocardioides sp.]
MDRRQRDRGDAIAPTLPAPRTPGHYAIALVCLGNICRSPMAEVVLTQRVDDAGLAGRVTVSSSGTGDWHVGQPMDERAAAILRANDFDPSAHRAQQFSPSWLATNDLVLAMDAGNLADVRRVTASSGGDVDPQRVRLFGDFDPVEPGGEVPDPYYGGPQGFEEVLAMVERTCAVLVSGLQRLPGLRDPGPGS